jgi:sigma-E factor negative regulatory protein RseC
MIEEEAYVAEVAQGRVWIEKNRKSACSGCAEACPSAVAGGLFGDQRVRWQVECGLALRPGDKVLVGVAEEALAGASLLIYLLPLLGLFAGALLGKYIAGSDLASALGGLTGLCFSIAGLKASRLFEREGFQPVILRKID